MHRPPVSNRPRHVCVFLIALQVSCACTTEDLLSKQKAAQRAPSKFWDSSRGEVPQMAMHSWPVDITEVSAHMPAAPQPPYEHLMCQVYAMLIAHAHAGAEFPISSFVR
jgi:hypothetical protein